MRITASLFLAALCTCAVADEPAHTQLAVPAQGYWKVKGTDARGEGYSSIATVVKIGHVYVITWVTGAGPVVRGSGLLRGEYLAVGWSQPGSAVAGCTLYQVRRAGAHMVGRWTASGGTIGDEEMTFFARFAEDE